MPENRQRVERYVAIGDSQTEGLHDYHGSGEPRGWADRFAEGLAADHPDLLYANLAVRGKRVCEIREVQLEPALRMRPDLATVVGGINDVLQPRADAEAIADELAAMYAPLVATGCTVMTCTFPLPRTGLTARVAPALRRLNAAIRTRAGRLGVLVVDCEPVEAAADLRLWAADRIHLNPTGHERLAAAFAGTLVGEHEEWKTALPAAREVGALRAAFSEAGWVLRYLVPKLVRVARGVSSGDGRVAKRPTLLPLD